MGGEQDGDAAGLLDLFDQGRGTSLGRTNHKCNFAREEFLFTVKAILDERPVNRARLRFIDTIVMDIPHYPHDLSPVIGIGCADLLAQGAGRGVPIFPG